nr:hypothetical protein [Azospirillum sp. 412522]
MRRLSADGNRRPVAERCGHHPAGTPGAVPLAAASGASLWRTMMERWLATAP